MLLIAGSLGIGGSEYNTSARIMEGPDEIIIGKDFLNNYGCIIDMSRNRYVFADLDECAVPLQVPPYFIPNK